MHKNHPAALAALALIFVTTLAACVGPASDTKPTTVTIVTHDSFSVPDALVADFEARTGLKVTFAAPGDAGMLTNQLVLTKDAPLGDVAYGVDNTFASRVADAGVFADYASKVPAAADAAKYAVPGAANLTAVDYSDVCLNIDLGYFSSHSLTPPATLEDLTKPEYKGLLSVSNPATSSPGLAFALETVAAFGKDWPAYWEALRANDVKVTSSWSDTYFTDFSAPNYGGDKPIVLSYASSPPSEVIDGKPTTAALLDTCFRQIEYVGVLEGAKNPQGAQEVVDWMLSDEFQSAMPDSMYVYPVSTTATIPPEWEKFAPLSSKPWSLTTAEIDAQRDDVISMWTATVLN